MIVEASWQIGLLKVPKFSLFLAFWLLEGKMLHKGALVVGVQDYKKRVKIP